MRVLLDTHVCLAITQGTLERRYPGFVARIWSAETAVVSVASLWEIAIKTRLGKLDPGMPLSEYADYVESLSITVIAIDRAHAVADVRPEPPTRDPFDRMLLAQCQVEGLRLVTADRALVGHPLAWTPG